MVLVWFDALLPSKQFFSDVGGGGKYVLLKGTTRRPEWGSNGSTMEQCLKIMQVELQTV